MRLLRIIKLELIKAWKHPLTWVVLLILLISVVATLFGAHALLQNGKLQRVNGEIIPVEEGLVNFTFPGALPSALAMARQVGSWLLIIFTAIFVGMEDAAGTVRVMLSTGISRRDYLAGKLGALLVIVVAFVAAALLAGTVSAFIIESQTSVDFQRVQIKESLVTAVLGMALRVIGTLYVPVLLAFLATICTRSQAAGVALGLGYQLFEAIVRSILQSAGAAGELLSPLLIEIDAATIMSRNSFNVDSAVSSSQPSIPVATAFLTGYAILFILASWHTFRKRDITSATR